MAIIKWTKPSGLEIETNDMASTVKYCESLKWVRSGAVAPAAAPDDTPEPPSDGQTPPPEPRVSP